LTHRCLRKKSTAEIAKSAEKRNKRFTTEHTEITGKTDEQLTTVLLLTIIFRCKVQPFKVACVNFTTLGILPSVSIV
jgi:hypothetical protein